MPNKSLEYVCLIVALFLSFLMKRVPLGMSLMGMFGMSLLGMPLVFTFTRRDLQALLRELERSRDNCKEMIREVWENCRK